MAQRYVVSIRQGDNARGVYNTASLATARAVAKQYANEARGRQQLQSTGAGAIDAIIRYGNLPIQLLIGVEALLIKQEQASCISNEDVLEFDFSGDVA